MTLSVIIPTLDEERTIRETLARLQRAAFSDILVVDGGSGDGTVALVSEAATGARLLTALRGRARQMNAGAAAATGDVLVFLHADTLLPPTAADDIRAALSNPDVVGGRFDAQFDRDRGLYWLVSRTMNWRSRLTGIATGDQAIFVRRTVFEAIGGFPDIPIMEDVAFSKCLKRRGRMAALRSCVVTSARRWERHGPMRTILLMWGLRLLFFLGVSPDRLHRLYSDVR